MYGTVAKFRVKPGVTAQDLTRMDEQYREIVRGYINTYVCQTDADPNVYYMVAIFESKEAYHANAQSPEQHERYLQFMALLDGEPEWNDGKVTASM
jgi:quinol monooxygenase YgiN